MTFSIGRRREQVSWSAEARALFTQIADEINERPEAKVGFLPRTGRLTRRPVVMVRRQVAVAGFEDGIAVRLGDTDRDRVLQIFATRELGRGDPMFMRRMIAMPWSTREHWHEFIWAAVNDALGRD